MNLPQKNLRKDFSNQHMHRCINQSIEVSIIIWNMRRGSTPRIKWIFRPTAMPVFKDFPWIRGVHCTPGIDRLKLPLCFSCPIATATLISRYIQLSQFRKYADNAKAFVQGTISHSLFLRKQATKFSFSIEECTQQFLRIESTMKHNPTQNKFLAFLFTDKNIHL